MNFIEFGRLALPDCSDEEIEHALWSHTGAPCFGTPKSFWRSLGTYRRAKANGIYTCDFCRRGAETADGHTCLRCARALGWTEKSPPHAPLGEAEARQTQGGEA